MPELPTLKPLTAPPFGRRPRNSKRTPQMLPHLSGTRGVHPLILRGCTVATLGLVYGGVRWCTVVHGRCTGGARPSPMASSAPRARYTAPRTSWCQQADALGWTARDLFGLAEMPERPGQSYQRLSRYDQTGLVWLLHGRRVVEFTKDKAVIETPKGTVSYSRNNKPALGPFGDSLDDVAPAIAANKSEATTVRHHGLPKPDGPSVPEFLGCLKVSGPFGPLRSNARLKRLKRWV
jgi:hypothetical protein